MEELATKKRKRYIHLILFLVTLVTTTLSGTWWIYGRNFLDPALTGQDVIDGLYFSIPFLLILSVHEFGHYFTAKYYNIDVTLPYFIPFIPFDLSIGTFGAVIRIKSKIESNTQNFDVGIAGPLAGFVIALLVLYYGFTHLPEKEHIYNIHPELVPHPKVEGKCDHCDGKLYHRKDDTKSSILKRLGIYHKKTEPILLKYKNKVHTIDARDNPAAIFARVVKVIEAQKSGLKR